MKKIKKSVQHFPGEQRRRRKRGDKNKIGGRKNKKIKKCEKKKKKMKKDRRTKHKGRDLERG